MPSSASPVGADQLVRVYHANKTQGAFTHGEFHLAPGGFCDVPQAVADVWLSHKSFGVCPVVLRKDDVTPPSVKLKNENLALQKDAADAQATIAELQARIKNLEAMANAAQSAANGSPEVPVVTDQAPGENAPSQIVLTGPALAAAQDKVGKPAKARKNG